MDDEEDGYTWTAPTECVWQAPGFLNISYVLAKDDDFRRNEKIRRLFTCVLEIKDGNWRYYLDQLDQDKSCNLEDYDVSRPSSIYSVLGRDVTDSDEWEQIRYVAPSSRYDCTVDNQSLVKYFTTKALSLCYLRRNGTRNASASGVRALISLESSLLQRSIPTCKISL